MKYKTVEVASRAGEPQTKMAQLVVCPECEKDLFCVFLISGHQHLQCFNCEETFCDGTCDTKPS